MKHVLGAIAAVAMVASVLIMRIMPSTSYDRVVLTVCIGMQVALLASLYSPFDLEAKTTMAWTAAINDDTREVAEAVLVEGTSFGGAIPDVVFGFIPPPTEFPDAESAEKFLTFLEEAGGIKEQMEQMIQNGEVGHDGP